jgi:hypothetical protein
MEKERKKGREKYDGVNDSGNNQRLGDGSLILGRGVVSYFSPVRR